MMRIGVLASHEGTTLQSIIDACADARINGQVVAVISNNSDSGALRRASAAGIEAFHLWSVTHREGDSLDLSYQWRAPAGGHGPRLPRRVHEASGPSHVGCLCRANSQHASGPAPKISHGQGMFGDGGLEAVLAAGEAESGASVHLVDAEYNTGGVVAQERVPVLPGDTVESLKARVQVSERQVVVNTLAAIAKGTLVLGAAG